MEPTNILIVDDRAENILALENVLESPELELTGASSGEEALRLLMQKEFALILLDVQMPVMDGFETAELIRGRAKTRNIPIIFVTAISKEQTYIFRGYDAGAVDYLFKPVDPTILRSKVRIFRELDLQRRMLERKIAELEETRSKLEEANSKLSDLSVLDGLTGVHNRRHFDAVYASEFQRAAREGSPLSVIMMDIDFFKSYNDFYGHLQGDKCLTAVAKTLEAEAKRAADLLARYGGEEFVAVLPAADEESALLVARSMREAVKRLALPHESRQDLDFVTLSLGIATMVPSRDCLPEDLLRSADEALYDAKRNGRNRECQVRREEMAEAAFSEGEACSA